MTADPVAAHGATPASCAMSAMPAMAQTWPGRYFPRLETVQIRAAVQASRDWPQAASMVRQATISRAYISHTVTALSTTQAGSILQASGWERSASQFRTSARAAKPMMRSANAHWAQRTQGLRTQRLAIPPLTDLRHVLR